MKSCLPFFAPTTCNPLLAPCLILFSALFLLPLVLYELQPMSEPAFYGRPPDLKEHALYNEAVPVRFDSEEENDANFNWCPEDDYQDCAFCLGGVKLILIV